MSKSWLIIGLVSFLLAGCADNNTEKETEADEAVIENLSSPVEENSAENETAVTPPEPLAPTAAPTAALNPPHGQPGHDCAIPVGAPLDGSGAQVQAQPQPQPQLQTLPNLSTQPVASPSAQAAAPANGINPPHGQPGHDCAVPVGDPLPSK